MKPSNKSMKRLFLYLFLILFTLKTLSWADDIRDFEIEGMSIGDSLLDYVTEEEIQTVKKFHFPNKKFAAFVKLTPESEIYDGYQVYYIAKDKTYKIHRLGGMILFKNNINDCYKKKDEIVAELSKLFKNVRKKDLGTSKHAGDKSGKSKTSQFFYIFDNGADISVECYDWSKEMNMTDKLAVSITSQKLRKHVDSGEAYKK